MTYRPQVGVGVLVRKGDRILLLRRNSTHGAGSWCPPGGHLEYGETLEACAIREAYEETGVTIGDVRFMGVTNDIFATDAKHYITLWMDSSYVSGKSMVNAPREVTQVGWYTLDALPHPLFLPLEQLLTGKLYIGHAFLR